MVATWCLALAAVASAGCASIRQYNSPEDRLQAAVETTRVGHPVRVVLSSGQSVEGTLISHNWPDMVFVVNGSRDSVDARYVVSIWSRGVSKRKGQLVGTVTGTVPFAVLAYALTNHPIVFLGSPHSKRASRGELVRATLEGGLFGGMLGAAVGTFTSSGSPEWQRTYP